MHETYAAMLQISAHPLSEHEVMCTAHGLFFARLQYYYGLRWTHNSTYDTTYRKTRVNKCIRLFPKLQKYALITQYVLNNEGKN